MSLDFEHHLAFNNNNNNSGVLEYSFSNEP